MRIAIASFLIAASCAFAQDVTPAADFLHIETIRLWPGPAPQASGNTPDDIPTLTVFSPRTGHGNRSAVIIAPGGAYIGLASDLEGREVADWYSARGITAFVLKYRLGKTNLFPVPLLDAQRAIRLVRSRAGDLGIDPARIGIMGFSAGGHLAASAATMFDTGNPSAPDPVDQVSSRPDFVVLGYPWLNAMDANPPGVLSYCSALHLSGPDCTRFEIYSPKLHVSPNTPPTFIFHTADDKTVPVSASIDFFVALHAAGVPVEMHIFETGHHGVGLGAGDPQLDLWPVLLEAWLRHRGILTQPAHH